nr:MAG TPA: hypothetical protein [Caudoviricetes sp.]
MTKSSVKRYNKNSKNERTYYTVRAARQTAHLLSGKQTERGSSPRSLFQTSSDVW